jgi:hypothetical protein
MTSQAFEDLAQALRVLLEARYRSNDLFSVDFAEAVGNIENGITGVLNSFHSLYDAMQKDGIGSRVDWYGSAELCLVLALRNARHHNVCSKVRTIFRYHLDTVDPPTDRKRYLMIDFEPGEEDASTFDVPLSIGDLQQLLALPSNVSRLRSGTSNLINEYINMPAINAKAASLHLSPADCFFNVIPLIVNAGIALHPHIHDRIEDKSSESKHFDFHFREVLPAKTRSHTFEAFEFWKP